MLRALNLERPEKVAASVAQLSPMRNDQDANTPPSAPGSKSQTLPRRESKSGQQPATRCGAGFDYTPAAIGGRCNVGPAKGAWVVNSNAYDFCSYIADEVGSWAPPLFASDQ
eukprot:g15727.t1